MLAIYKSEKQRENSKQIFTHFIQCSSKCLFKRLLNKQLFQKGIYPCLFTCQGLPNFKCYKNMQLLFLEPDICNTWDRLIWWLWINGRRCIAFVWFLGDGIFICKMVHKNDRQVMQRVTTNESRSVGEWQSLSWKMHAQSNTTWYNILIKQ